MWVCWSLWTSVTVPLLKLWVWSVWLCISLFIIYQEQMYVHICKKKKKKDHIAVSGGVWPWGRYCRCLLCSAPFGIKTLPAFLGRKQSCGSGWDGLLYLEGDTMGCSLSPFFFFFPFSHGNVYLFSLCVASQSEIKTTPNRIHVSIFVWRSLCLLAGSAFPKQLASSLRLLWKSSWMKIV